MPFFRMLAGTAVLGAALALAGAAAEAGNVLRWASQGDALTADPHSANETPTNAASRQIYDTLVYPDKDLAFRPWLATSWSLETPTSWVFRLREGVRWHDGTPFSADDVKFSIERALSPTSDFRRQIASIARVDVLGAHAVRVVTKGPNPILPNDLSSIFIMSRAWAARHGAERPQDWAGKEESFTVRNAMGTGPFKLRLREPDARTVLVRNEDWWGLAEFPHEIDEIVYTPIANQATRVAALLSGQVDFLLDPPLQDLARIRRTPGVSVKQTAQVRTIFLGMNQGRPRLLTSDAKGRNPFADRRVRLALYQAIDIEAIRDKVMRGHAVPAGIIAAPAVRGHTPALDARRPYDLAAARELMAEAGHADGFSVRLDCPNNRYINDEAICQAVTAMLGKIGVRARLSALPKTLHFPKIKNRETDFYLLGWGVPTLDSHYVFSFLARGGQGTWNGTGFSDPEIDRKIDAIEVEIDPAKRDRLIAEVWRRMKDEIIYLPLHHQVIAWAMRDRLDIPISADDEPRFIYARLRPR